MREREREREIQTERQREAEREGEPGKRERKSGRGVRERGRITRGEHITHSERGGGDVGYMIKSFQTQS